MAVKFEQCEALASCVVKKSRNGERNGRHGDYHYWVKRYTARYRRREARRLLDDAPARNYYRGYEG